MAERREPQLYRNGGERRNRAEFDRRYPGRGKYVEGATIGKVARERAAKNGGREPEFIRPHRAENPGGEGSHEVKGYNAYVYAHPHSRGEHAGACSKDCRKGWVAHRHKRRRKSPRGR